MTASRRFGACRCIHHGVLKGDKRQMEKVSSINNYNTKSPDLYGKLAELEAQIAALRQNQQQQTAPVIIIEKLYVRRVAVEELQFKLDKITVDDLSGMLNVGINSDGKMKKTEQNKE